MPSGRLSLRVRGIILAKRKIRENVCLCEGYIAMNTLKIVSGQELFFKFQSRPTYCCELREINKITKQASQGIARRHTIIPTPRA
jgi:hypothetical protein